MPSDKDKKENNLATLAQAAANLKTTQLKAVETLCKIAGRLFLTMLVGLVWAGMTIAVFRWPSRYSAGFEAILTLGVGYCFHYYFKKE